MVRLRRVYHDCREWEEMKFNMWGEVDNQKEALQKAIEFTSNHKQYGQYMMRVVNEWPISCENALTDENLNKRAWVGHSAVALALQIPEDITRKAWGYLTDEQRFLANKEATRAIQYWTISYTESRGLQEDLVQPMLW